MPLTEIVGLVLAAAVGGVINAVAGGGTLITFPALLFFGTPPVIANATSTLALVLGTSGGIYGYREHLPAVRPWLARFVPISLLGGFIGALLLTRTSNQTFSRLVPFLILFATLLFLSQGVFRSKLKLQDSASKTHDPDVTNPGHVSRFTSHDPGIPDRSAALFPLLLFQFLIALYGGYFGAGIGILMLASLGFLGLRHIHEMNALKTILSSLINLVATFWFILAGLIHWPKAGLMTMGAVAGYYLGSHFSQRIPQERVRQTITLIGFALSAATFYKQFLR